jgi:hypothetical protein
MHRILSCALIFCSAGLLAADLLDDWRAVTALDAGPGVQPKTSAEAFALAQAHSEKQEKALRAYLAAHPAEANAFEALLRLARVLDLRAEMKAGPQAPEVLVLLEKAGQLATTPARQSEFEFALLTRRMRKWRTARPPTAERRELLEQARQFDTAHPGDRRTATLFAEIAALFDFEPDTKGSLLLKAKELTKDPELTAQIADDLRRFGFLGKVIPLRFTALDGRRVDVTVWRGKVVGIVFFATWSAPSTTALVQLRRAIDAAGGRAEMVAVSLDADRAELESFLKTQGIKFPVAWDGKGWDSPLMQALGINSLPTTWLLDKQGVLRSLDALEEPEAQIRHLLDARQ